MKITPLLSLSLASALLAGPTAALAAGAPALSVSVTAEEAVGPFASWGNVKTKYHAVGDGKADDTAALQSALDDMNLNEGNIEKSGSPAVLYFPAGTYRITRTLVSKNKYGASLVGENPANTSIVWDGPAGGTMLIADGVFGGKYARLTWNGMLKGSTKKAGIGVAHWWNKKTPQYGGSPEHVDEVFVDMGVGIVAGCCGASRTTDSHPDGEGVASEYGDLDSEGSVKRTKFIRNTVAGVSTESANALNWWVMDSEFTDCGRGVTNALERRSGAGNVHVYRNLFRGSTVADIHVGRVQWQSMHNNVSVGSVRFLQADVAGNNGKALILKNNRILNHSADKSPIFIGNVGPLVMIDNQILSPLNASGPLIQQSNNYTGTPGAGIILVGNKVTVAAAGAQLFAGTHTPVDVKVTHPQPNLLAFYDTTTVERNTIPTALPVLPPTAVNRARAVFEVPVTTNATTHVNETTTATIQAVIKDAVASTDPNPIVHFGRATYTIDAPLEIPAGRRIQLVGDGIATRLKAGGKLGNQPLLRLRGPSLATIRELRLFSNGYTVTAVELDNADQAGGRILFDGGMNGVVNLSKLASTKVEFQRSSSIRKLNASGAASVLAMGSGGIGPLTVNNSNVMVADTWFETGYSNLTSDPMVRGTSGNFTYLGGHIAPPVFTPANTTPPTPAGASILVDGFAGQFTVMGLSYDMQSPEHGIEVRNELPSTKALFMGVSANDKGGTTYYRRSYGAGFGTVGFRLMRHTGVQPLPDQATNKGLDKAAVLAGMAQMRAQTWDTVPKAIPAGATDVLFYRVRTIETKVGYNISGQ
ncbi:glycosyl hydrolase family 28-related protein [Massilia pseudoviolaceinigra]|uniref:glycosyl hydrolase family 28-related protein n=1 Tax=Massilia pseudoviolaceinigra TaxID=3057165 RepID=UPI002796B31A|nr:glycosyl hydrolase family 28-related protein [Massilia sp. CCM 9206]MDQ1919853.1 glycosyl hydrolase family 28-related protein [Massilia sp. CCM 9206]